MQRRLEDILQDILEDKKFDFVKLAKFKFKIAEKVTQ